MNPRTLDYINSVAATVHDEFCLEQIWRISVCKTSTTRVLNIYIYIYATLDRIFLVLAAVLSCTCRE
jgi:hypothetical protein